MTNTIEQPETPVTPTNTTHRRVSLRTLSIMAASVAAAGALAAPSVVDALDTRASGSIEQTPEPTAPENNEPTIAWPENIEPEVTNSLPELDWQPGELMSSDWDDCPGCGLG